MSIVEAKAKERLASLLKEKQKALSFDRLSHEFGVINDPYDSEVMGVYGWQAEFCNAGSHYPNRCLAAANRVGKSRTVSAEVACHATGEYPDWWKGKRFNHPVKIACGSETSQASRDIVQEALLGPVHARGTGWIPKRCIHPDGPKMTQSNVSDVAELVRVRHKSGGWSTIYFKAYSQEREKWQGVAWDICWLDEQPPESIYGEASMRLLDRRGSMILSFTPLQGMSDVLEKYMGDGADSRGHFFMNATWDDAYHLSDEDKQQALANCMPHEIECRARGLPMMGEGRVWPIEEARIVCDPFPIPPHYRRICGIDFGIDHPFAAVWLAHDADADVIYAYDSYQIKGEVPAIHANAIRSRGKWVPVAWPHDGHNRDKGSGKQLAESYIEEDVEMLPLSARYEDDKGSSQGREPSILNIFQRMRADRFKIFSNQRHLLEEIRLYHRKDGKIVDKKDDLISAMRYGEMMIRHALTESEAGSLDNHNSSQGSYEPMNSILGV